MANVIVGLRWPRRAETWLIGARRSFKAMVAKLWRKSCKVMADSPECFIKAKKIRETSSGSRGRPFSCVKQ